MLIDSLTFTLEKSGCLDAFWGKLDAGEDGTLGVASSARPFLVAARFAHRPQPTLVVVAGEDAAVAFSRSLAAYLGDERVMRFPERSDYPFVPKPSDPAQVARRMEAVHALASGRDFGEVAQELSEDSGSAVQNGSIGYMDADSDRANKEVTRWTVGGGYEYALSKRTAVYGGAAWFEDTVDNTNPSVAQVVAGVKRSVYFLLPS